MVNMWTCIAFTCSDPQWAQALREELIIFQKQNLLRSSLQCFVLEDPAGTVGSGGATLNALLVTVERLCNLNGHTTVTADVLKDAHILIIHHGRDTCYWPNGKAFLPTSMPRENESGLKTQLEGIVSLCSQLKKSAPPGVWIASTDSLLWGKLTCLFDWSSTPDALLLTVPCSKEDTQFCGLVKTSPESVVQEITFTVDDTNKSFDVVGGVVYFQTAVAETLLNIHWRPPLDCCTYIGADNGDPPLQLSLYFDILGPMCKGVSQEAFLSNSYGSSYDITFGTPGKENKDKLGARKILWEHLKGYQLEAFSGQGLHHCYWTDHLPLEKIFLTSGMHPSYQDCPKILHSFLDKEQDTQKLVCINSSIQIPMKSSRELFVICSQIQGATESVHFQGRAYLINVNINLEKVPNFYLNDNSVLIGHFIRVDQQLQQGVAVFSAVDVPNLEFGHPKATIFGVDWNTYFTGKGIQADDLWPGNLPIKSLKTAKLFPIAQDITSWKDLLWLQDPSTRIRLNSWRSSIRYSMDDFIHLAQPADALKNMRSTAATSLAQSVRQWPSSLIPYFQRACAENWIGFMLEALDKAAASCENSSQAARLLAAVADLLGCAAGNEAGLRSGPAYNKDWDPAFDLLENISLEEGVLSLARQREKWMSSPERVVRAARHYERAVHILIRKTVKSVSSKIAVHRPLQVPQRPPIKTLIQVECPARIDLSGGWSDTPPICYEMGGSVVNIAILVDGKRPIGATGRRITDLQLVLTSEGQSEPLILTNLEQVFNYTNPTAPGALLKAALVCAGVVRADSPLNFQDQLRQSLGGGLELHGWSSLPQGSGLGTSSILAAALLAVIYTAMGVTFTRSQLIHAVLYIEQLLTTGGGWQDQVGGVMGGCNRGHSPADPDVRVYVDPLPLGDQMVRDLDHHLLLMHTGKVRLARNLLQNVIRQWYARQESIVSCFQQLVVNAQQCAASIAQGDLERLGRAIDVYWAQKREIAPGCQPHLVGQLMDRLRSLVYGQSLTGAGGGGFYFAVIKEPYAMEHIKQVVAAMEGGDNITFYKASVDRCGITMKVDGQPIDIH